jgi:hypothetical protein
MRLRKADLGMGVGLILFGLGVVVATLRMSWDIAHSQGAGWYAAPGAIQLGIAVVLILQGIFLARTALREGGRWERSDLAYVRAGLASPSVKRAGIVALLLSVYVFGLVGRLHFTLASFLFVAAVILLFGKGPVWRALLIAGVASVSISFLFQQLAGIPLP